MKTPYVGPVGPSDSEPAGSVDPYVAGGPVGPYETLSPFNSDPAGPVGPYVAGGPVGPYGTLSPFDSDGPVGRCGMLSLPTPVAEGPMGPGETLSSPDPAGILSLAVPAGIFLPVGSVGPVGPYGMVSLSDSESAILVDPGGCCPCLYLRTDVL